MLKHELDDAVCSMIWFRQIWFQKNIGGSVTDVCQSAVDDKLGMAVVDAFTGQRWWRSGMEADAEIVVG